MAKWAKRFMRYRSSFAYGDVPRKAMTSSMLLHRSAASLNSSRV